MSVVSATALSILVIAVIFAADPVRGFRSASAMRAAASKALPELLAKRAHKMGVDPSTLSNVPANTNCTYPTPNPEFVWPGDLSMHVDQNYEWVWYVGNFRGLMPEHRDRWFGVEAAIIRVDFIGMCSSIWESVWIMDFALADQKSGIHYWKGYLGLADEVSLSGQNTTQTLRGLLNDWWMIQDPQNTDHFNLQLNVSSDCSVTGGNASSSLGPNGAAWAFHVNFDLIQDTPGAVPIANNGFEVDGNTPAWHYDQPNLRTSNRHDHIERTNAITLNGERIDVEGAFWNQHMFMSSEPEPVDTMWDWGYAHFTNGLKCAFQHFRFPNGTTWIDQSYINCFNVPPPYQQAAIYIPGTEWTTTRTNEWVSPYSGLKYTLEPTYTIPSLELTMTLTPRVTNQELLLGLPAGQGWYYEGAATVSGTFAGQPIEGVGYSEQWLPYQGV